MAVEAGAAALLEPDASPRPSVLTIAAIAVAFVVLVCVVAGQWLAPVDPEAQNLALGVSGPVSGHPLGTDQIGRDVLSQVMAGARPAIVGPACVALGCLLIGCSLGMLAGYSGGAIDAVINRYADLIYALPALLVAIVVLGVTNGGYWLTVVIAVLLSMPYQIRLSRSATQVQARLPYVDAARTLGLPLPRVLLRHVLPNIAPTVVASVLLDFVGALIVFASLQFLGLGVEAGSPAWGTMIADGQSSIFLNPWASIAPGIMLILTAVSVTLIWDWAYGFASREAKA
jgi:ABC-type dipeptide/oligopeptide/nickel transport system permease subunit